MKTVTNILSGSTSSWVVMGINMLSQIALIPIYLTHWDTPTYSVWLAIQALVALLSIIDKSHQSYLGYEFLRVGGQSRRELGISATSGIVWSGILNLLLLLTIVYVVGMGGLSFLMDVKEGYNAELIQGAGIVLLVQLGVMAIFSNFGGILIRALAPFGYYARLSWWGVFTTLINTIVPAFAVYLGGSLLTVGLVYGATFALSTLPVFVDIFSLLKKEQISLREWSLQKGWLNLSKSLVLAGKDFLDNARQQGIRLILLPLTGAVALVSFNTLRTGANVALQGLNTITNPLMPELMRFIHKRDQERVEAAFGTVWIVLLVMLTPGVVLLQALMEPIFVAWTRGRVPYDPYLFATLSLTVLVYAVAQPAMSVVAGNNLLSPQLTISILAAVVMLGCTFLFVSQIGIRGAGLSLLIAEIISCTGYWYYAQHWLQEHGLVWPRQMFTITISSVVIATCAMVALILFPPTLKGPVILGTMLLLAITARRYWQALPSFATIQAKELFLRLPGIRLLIPVK